MYFCRHCNPCDTLPHNVVYDGVTLHLIDVDESFTEGIAERHPPNNLDDDNWPEALRYPDYFRKHVHWYALVQLAYLIHIISADIPATGVDYTNSIKLANSMMLIGRLLLKKLRHVNQLAIKHLNATPLETDIPLEIAVNLRVVAESLTELLHVTLPESFPRIPHVLT